MKQTMGRFAARSAAFALACSFVAGCGGTRLLPTPTGPGAGAAGTAPVRTLAAPSRSKRKVRVQMHVRIPARTRAHAIHPATISPLTQSVAIAVDGGTAQVFDTTPTSPNCSSGASGRTCSFSVLAPVGTDAFAVTTYDTAGATGHPLDYAVANVPIATGKANTLSITLGPVVSNTADSGVGSLRYAIGSAGDGDTIVFLLAAGSTITLATPIVVFNNVTIAGPGASALSISGGNATQLFQIYGVDTISGVTLAKGSATGSNPGGDILSLGSLTLANDVVGDSSSTAAAKHGARSRAALRETLPQGRLHPHCSTTYAYGGAIANGGNLVTSGTTFTGNFVPSNFASCIEGRGGVIYNTGDGTISSSGDTFAGNSAYQGGAVYTDSAAPATFTNDTFSANIGCTTSSGCPTSGCTGTGCGSFAQGEGAAIYDDGTGVTIASSTFTGNVAGGPSNDSVGEGGALYLSSGTPSISNSTFTGNVAGGGSADCSMGEGGAIFADVNVEVDGSTFENNEAAGDSVGGGGAILSSVPSAMITGANDTFASNQATGSGSACASSGTAIGAAVYATGGAAFTNSTFTGNAASANTTAGGGAILCGSCTLAGDTFTGNSATATAAGSPSSTESVGGALAASSVAKITGSTFTSNTVTSAGSASVESFGGAIYSDGASASIVSSGNAYASNQAVMTAGTGAAAGGAIAVYSGSLSSSGDTFSSNTATSSSESGAGAILANGSYAISTSKFTSNSAVAPTVIGGALNVQAHGSLTGDTFSGNAATATAGGVSEGGAIVDNGGATILDSTISQNTAASGGGGIASASASETIVNSTIAGNSVTNANIANAGGGGLNDEGGATIEYSTIANNTVALAGGPGPSGGGGIYNSGGLTLELSTVSGNVVTGSTTGGGGGGIFNEQGATITNSTIAGNASSLDGGGIEFAANDADALENATVFQNTAAGKGGNIDNLFALTLSNSIVAGGGAPTGADIDNHGTITSGDYNIIQTAVAGTGLTGAVGHTRTIDPQLLPLANNGGPTFTNADQATSPGTGFIPYAGGNCGSVALTVDQRGYTRGTGGTCDVGAYEFAGVATAIRHHPIPKAHRFAGHPGSGLKIPRLVLAIRRPDPLFSALLRKLGN